jgi:hypothetical protein
MPDEPKKAGEAEKTAPGTPAWANADPFVPTASPAPEPAGKAEPAPAASPSVEVDPSLEAKPQGASPAPSRPASSARTSTPSGSSPSTRTPYAADEDTDPGYRRSRRKYWGLPGWGWWLAILTFVGAMLLVADLRNRNRYLMVCKAAKVELHKGRTFPWPFGHENVGGAEFRPVAIPAETDCRTRVFYSQEEAELGFLDFILGQVREALDKPGSANLAQAREQVLQAMLLTRTHRARRSETQKLLAELAYREGRAGLARIENELRTALARFQEAQKLDGERWEDLDDWIAHLEDLLRTVSPSPGGTPFRPTGRLPQGMPQPLPSLPGSSPPPTPPASSPVSPETDAGAPQTGGGILM